MEFVELLKEGEIVLGIVVSLISTVCGGFVWWDRRNKRYSDANRKLAKEDNRSVVERLAKVEGKVSELEDDVGILSRDVAKLPDATEFRRFTNEISGLAAAQLKTSNHVEILLKAALAASHKGAN